MSKASFQFRADEPLDDGVRRVMREQLESALVHLNGCAETPLDERIHEVRKTLKRLRALVRLVRGALGDVAYRSENTALRDAARPLSPWRDSKVLLEALANVRQAWPDASASDAFHQAHRLLDDQRRSLMSEGVLPEELRRRYTASLQATLDRMESWPAIPDRWSSIRPGLNRVYRRGRKGFKRAANNPSPLLLHEWRKQVKYLRHQLELFSENPSKKLKRLIGRATELGELLGKDHDLVILSERLHSHIGDEKPQGFDELLAVMAARRDQLQAQAFSIAPKLFRQQPRRFVSRIRRWRERSKR